MNQILAPNTPQSMNQILASNTPQPMNQILGPNNTLSPSTLYMTPITTPPNTPEPIYKQKLKAYKDKIKADPNGFQLNDRSAILVELANNMTELSSNQLTKEQKLSLLTDITSLIEEMANFTSIATGSNSTRPARNSVKSASDNLTRNVMPKLQ